MDAGSTGGYNAASGDEQAVFTDTIPIFVEAEWGGGLQSSGGVQLCPAIFVPSFQQISPAVKYVYSRLASSSDELDEGIPHMVLSLVGTGNSFNHEESRDLVDGLCRVVNKCGLWIVTSGERDDPMAMAAAESLRSVLPQEESREETLIIAVNSSDVAHKADDSAGRHAPTMVDSCLNTMYIVWNRSAVESEKLLAFRTCAAAKLATPPPALLIGIPDERSNASQTPTGPTTPAILLPSSSQSTERRPLSVALFCGASLDSLTEIDTYIQCGIPVLVVQDVSDLCALLKSSFMLYHQAGFEHGRFTKWLESELRKIASSTTPSMASSPYTPDGVTNASERICRVISTAFHNSTSVAVSFIAADELPSLPDRLLQLLLKRASTNGDANAIYSTLYLAVKLNCPRVIESLSLEAVLDKEVIWFGVGCIGATTALDCVQRAETLIKGALIDDDRSDILAVLLDQKVPINISSALLVDWLASISDQYFFNIVILGHLLGYKRKLEKITEHTAKRINDLLCELTGGVGSCVFKSDYFVRDQPAPSYDHAKAVQTMAVWALLMNRVELVKLFCAHSYEPIALSILLAKAARALARMTREWCLSYETGLNGLSEYLNSMAVQLLDGVYRESPTRAYQTLCRRLGASFNHHTLPQLAYECNAKEFIAHECCQRWMMRLLYGNLQIRSTSIPLPRPPTWLKILLCALFIIPAHYWVARRPPRRVAMIKSARAVSPTVALLEEGRRTRKVTHSNSSTYSVHSLRSGSIYGVNRIRDDKHQQLPLIAPQSAVPPPDTQQPNNALLVDDTDSFVFSNSMLPPPAAMIQLQATGNNHAADPPVQGTWSSHTTSPSFTRARIRSFRRRALPGDRTNSTFVGKAILFYSTTITKYWLSLAFRVLYLLTLAYAVTLPGCGFLPLNIALWLWALMWLAESLMLLNAQDTSTRENPWMVFDVFCLSSFLLAILTAEVGATYLPVYSHFAGAYTLKMIWAGLLLYECYKTLFIYIPLSDVLGPFLIRMKLMLMRDLPHFFLLSALFVISSGVVIKAVVYPDQRFNPIDSISWAFLSFFDADLDILNESTQCHRMLLSNEKRHYCKAVSGYSDPTCPKVGWFAHLTIYEYLFILKFISFPILFALFARTARKVDGEAEKLWRYQIYSLAMQFSRRPLLPPPFTPLVLVWTSCCRRVGRVSDVIWRCVDAGDHPDVGAEHTSGSMRKFSNVYRNPSVPLSKISPYGGCWTRLAVNYWKESRRTQDRSQMESTDEGITARGIGEKLQLLLMSSGLHAAREEKVALHVTDEGESDIDGETGVGQQRRPNVSASDRPWGVLLPFYCPPDYSKRVDEFPADLQKHVEDSCEIVEIVENWRRKKLAQLLSQHDGARTSNSVLSLSWALPLNPAGRTGLAGRGNFLKYGPNRIFYYVLIARNEDDILMILLDSASRDLPSKWQNGTHRSDEHLYVLLTAVEAPDADVQILTSRSHLAVGQFESRLGHVLTQPMRSSEATDNAWPEADVWAVDLSSLSLDSLAQEMEELEWVEWNELEVSQDSRKFVDTSLLSLGLKP